jgi:hypothetical protein
MTTMTRLACGNCGIEFDVPDHFYEGKRSDKSTWYCPNGHPRVFRESNADVLRRERDRLQQRLAEKDDTISRLEREKSAVKGQITKMKNRASNGVCPCCTRSFTNLRRHMETKHPEFRAAAAE